MVKSRLCKDNYYQIATYSSSPRCHSTACVHPTGKLDQRRIEKWQTEADPLHTPVPRPLV